MSIWRLIISPPLDGARNMAIDEVLLTSRTHPTLRLYSWRRPTVSLGYSQKAEDNLLRACGETGVDVVRRPTGGRAVLHQREITYSVSASYKDLPGPPTLKGIYSTLAIWQINSLKDIGIEASMAGAKEGRRYYTEKPACFLTSTPYELVVSGKKICGSAQKRGRYSFIQHGSLLLDLDRDLFSAVFGETWGGISPFTTLKDEGYDMDEEKLMASMVKNFTQAIGCKLKKCELSEKEMAGVDRIMPQYAHP